jgi:two-component system sensor kinase FixL
LTLAIAAVLAVQWRIARRGRRQARELTQLQSQARKLVHDLNQPLTAILSNTQAALRFLAAGQLDLQELREILDDVVQDDKRAAAIVRHLAGLLQEAAAETKEGAGATAQACKEGAA